MAKVLITEDSAYMRRMTCGIIRRAGHEIVEATNGEECLRKIVEEEPDLVLLDLVMPERDGISVLGRLKKRGISVPVIVLTADIQDSVRQGCMGLGAVAFLNKPPKEEALMEAVRRALQGGRDA